MTWHPLFPAIVAVWFGALFGLGALAVHVSLIERLALASGIELILPAAAPPLGTSARILVALALAMTGGVLGAIIGNLMARSKPSARIRRAEAAAAAARAPTAEFVEAKRPKRERTDAEPSFIDISQLHMEHELKIDSEEIEVDQAEPEGEGFQEIEETVAPPEQTFRRPLDPVSFPLPAAFPAPGGAAAQRLTSADLESLSHLELIERLALSLQKRREEAGQAAGLDDADAARPAAAVRQPSCGSDSAPEPQVPAYYPPAPDAHVPRIAAAPVALSPAQPEACEGEADEEGTEGPYSSLLGLVRSAADETRLAEVAPAAAHVAALRNDPAATDRALREALSALQRMSGAA